MKLFSKFILIIVLVLGIGVTINNFALSKANSNSNIAVVNVQEIIKNYDKVNILKDQQKAKLDELKKFVADAKTKISEEKNTTKKKTLEDNYNKELQARKTTINTEYQIQLADINKNITNTINNIGKKNNYDLILVKNSVLYGGKDITADVLKYLK